MESKLESLKAMMLDLQAEASFFDSTASEAAVSSVFHNQFIINAYETWHKRLFKAAVALFIYFLFFMLLVLVAYEIGHFSFFRLIGYLKFLPHLYCVT